MSNQVSPPAPIPKEDNNNNTHPKCFSPSKCHCKRVTSGVVFCFKCGRKTKGRAKLTCPTHEKTMYLHDIAVCPTCFAPADPWLRDLPGPPNSTNDQAK